MDLDAVHAEQPETHPDVEGVTYEFRGVSQWVHAPTVPPRSVSRCSAPEEGTTTLVSIVDSPVTPDVAGPTPASSGDLAPPVAVIVVAHNPGEWFDETLGSLAAQTYENLIVHVVDAGSDEPIASRVGAVLPSAVCHRLDHSPGFGPACNLAVEAVGEVAFYLFCHDDVALGEDAVTQLVAEAFRSNAGVVGPKLVMWHDPDRLLALGMGSDRFGNPAPVVDPGELDQGQHDGIREVFYVPGSATLVRSDLFSAIGGFDPALDVHGEDLDLGWRARVVGASVVVAPSAVVLHLEALGLRRRDDRRRRQLQHRQRTLRTATTGWSRAWLLPLAALLNLLEVVAALILWRPRHVADVAAAWWWNLTRRSSLKERRASLAASRAVADSVVRERQVSGSARLRALARARRALAAGEHDEPVEHVPAGRLAIAAWCAVAAVLVVGSRGLITEGIPAVGDFASFPDSASELFSSWWSTWRPVGAGAAGVSPPLLALFWLASVATLGATAVARVALILLTLPIAALGVWRLVTPVGGTRARAVALVVAIANPLTYDALANGRWSTLVLCAVLPWVVLHLARGARIAPFDRPGWRVRRLRWHLLAAGLLTGAATLWVPMAPLVVVMVVVALVLGGLLSGNAAGSLRLLGVGLGAAAVASVLCAPWLVSLIGPGGPAVWLASAAGDGVSPSALALLRFETGPVGASLLSSVLVLVGLPALLIGRGWRLAWAGRAWMVIVVAWGAVLAAGQGWLGPITPVPDLLLASAVSMLALAAATGSVAVESDLPGHRVGWRHVLAGVALVSMFLASLPIVLSALGGRWEVPERDYEQKLAFMTEARAEAPFRVLWVSDPALLPTAGWALGASDPGPALAWSTTASGLADTDDLFTVPERGGTAQIGQALESAADGETVRLGALVGPMAVRYVVVPLALGPRNPVTVDGGGGVVPESLEGLIDTLSRQLDLASVPVGGDLRVWTNEAWVPTSALYDSGSLDDLPEGGGPGPQQAPALDGGVAVLGDGTGDRRGELPSAGSLFLAELADGWTVTTGSGDAEREVSATPALGWSQWFDDLESGAVTVTRSDPIGLRIAVVVSPLLWVVALWWLVRRRRQLATGTAPSVVDQAAAAALDDLEVVA